MILFHGTSTSRAARVQEFGFEYPDLESEIKAISRRYEVGFDILKDQLTGLSRIVASRGDDRKIYFSSHFMHAASYATRAPEFYWEALWAVYIIWNPQLGLEWNQSDEGHAWVLSQMQYDPPVVLHVEVPDEQLGRDADRLRRIREDMPANSESGGAEVGLCPSSNLHIVDQTACDYWIDSSLLRFLSGLSPEELSKQVIDGVWGTPFSYQFNKNWLWLDVKSRLSPQRLAQLQLD